MSADSVLAHLTPQSPLPPAIQAWEMYLIDQGRSPNTVKAFLSDVRILTQFLPPDRALGDITTRDLNRYFEWMENERPVPCSPKTLARRITSTKSFFRWLHQYGVLLVDPAAAASSPIAMGDQGMIARLYFCASGTNSFSMRRSNKL